MMEMITFSAMSTVVEVGIFEKEGKEIFPYLSQFVEMMEDTFSRFRKHSELSYLNDHIGEDLIVSPIMFEVLAKAHFFFEDTNGLFHPGILPLLQKYGYHTSIEKIVGKEVGGQEGMIALPSVPFTLHDDKESVTIHGPIDLGGIVKGWIVDEIVDEYFRGYSGYVNIGGDLRVFGKVPMPLIIGIEDPYDAAILLDTFELNDRAAATSSVVKRSWLQNGQQRHHIVHPKKQAVAPIDIGCATVLAPTTIEADVGAKVFLLLGETEGLKWIREKQYEVIYVTNLKQVKRGERYE